MKLTSASRSFRLSNGNDEILTPMPLWAAQIEMKISVILPALKNILYKSLNPYNKEKIFDIVNSDKFLRIDSIRNIQKSQRNIVEFL